MREYGEQSRQSTHRNGSEIGDDNAGVLAELVDEAIVRLDAEGVISDANSRFEILTGSSATELTGSPLSAFVVENDGDRLGAVLRALRTQDHGTQTTLGVSLRTDSEEAIACQLSLAVAEEGDGRETPTEIVGTVRPVDTADAGDRGANRRTGR
jgi:PAS domain S-box-containing protein